MLLSVVRLNLVLRGPARRARLLGSRSSLSHSTVTRQRWFKILQLSDSSWPAIVENNCTQSKRQRICRLDGSSQGMADIQHGGAAYCHSANCVFVEIEVLPTRMRALENASTGNLYRNLCKPEISCHEIHNFHTYSNSGLWKLTITSHRGIFLVATP